MFSDFKDLVVQLRKQGYNRYENMIQKQCMAVPGLGVERTTSLLRGREVARGRGLVSGRHFI